MKILTLTIMILFFSLTSHTQELATVFAPGIISGPANDASPAFTPDGKTVYFSRGDAILISHLRGKKWSSPVIAPFSGKWRDLEPAISPDGSFIIFISNRPANVKGEPLTGFFNGQTQPGKGGNLWRIDLAGSHPSEPTRLPNSINRSSNIYAPSIVRDGSIYFMESVGEKHRFRLFRSQFFNGVYQSPEAVSFSTEAASDFDPAVAPDESFCIFSSSRQPAQSTDLFIVFRQNGVWGEPINLGSGINSPGSEIEARLSPDGNTVYFSSERTMPVTFPRTLESANRHLERIKEWDNGGYNIWQFSLTDWLKTYHSSR